MVKIEPDRTLSGVETHDYKEQDVIELIPRLLRGDDLGVKNVPTSTNKDPQQQQQQRSCSCTEKQQRSDRLTNSSIDVDRVVRQSDCKKALRNNNGWMKMYQRLESYKKKHNSTRVPRKYKADPRLGAWVKRQRDSCKKKDRIDLLDKIGLNGD